MSGLDGVRTLNSQQPSSEVAEEPPPPPPAQEPETPEPEKPAEKPTEEEWKESYDEMITPDKPAKPKKKRHWGAIIITVIVILILVVWTLMSPSVMTQVGDEYTKYGQFSSLGNYTGYRDIWAGNMTWGVSISGPQEGGVGENLLYRVLITKVFESPGNWFFRGTSIDVKNISFFDSEGVFFGSSDLTSGEDGFGVMSFVHLNFTQAGSYDLHVYVKFLVYEIMRIGYMPLETVQVTPGVDIETIVIT